MAATAAIVAFCSMYSGAVTATGSSVGSTPRESATVLTRFSNLPVSVHLSDLKDLGIIKEKRHSEDERKKIFYLSSKLLGKSDTPFDVHYRKILENLKETEGDEYEFLKSLFHLIRYGLISFGLDIHPALKEIGKDAGRSIAENFSSQTEEELKEEIGEFWRSTGLGKVEISESYITIKDCFDCGDMPEVGHTLCSLDEGMIEGIYEERLGKEVTVREVECFGTGERHCRFKID